MGQVYQATDTKLGREVALKILPEAFATDPDRLARFQREAQVLASLNHPGIAAIYGIQEQDDTRALVLELVEGPTLADRISKGPIRLDEALPIAKQIAEALEAAHEAAVIHRDLKPANIKVKDDGTVKVLDFGLAKALDTTPAADSDQLPTRTSEATQTGTVLGTAAYMSPEQARGKSVDRRSDIWAFGVVLYEMLTGTRAFRGEAVADCRATIIERNPDYDALPPVPPSIRQLVFRCLEKDQRERLRDIGDARIEIKQALATPPNDAHRKSYVPPSSGTEAVPVLGEQENSRRQEEIEAYKVAGLVTVAAGIGLGIFLYFLDPSRPLYLVGLMALMVGLALLLTEQKSSPRATLRASELAFCAGFLDTSLPYPGSLVATSTST